MNAWWRFERLWAPRARAHLAKGTLTTDAQAVDPSAARRVPAGFCPVTKGDRWGECVWTARDIA